MRRVAVLGRIAGWRLKTPFYYGWLVLGITALGTFVSTSVGGLVLGGTQSFILEEMKWPRSTIGLAVTVGVWFSGLISPVVGRLTDRYGARWLMPFGAACLGISLYFIARVGAVWQFYLIVIIGRAISQPVLTGVVPRAIAVNFFRRRRNFALSLAGISRPISAALNIQLISLVALAYGWRTAFRLLGFASLGLIAVFALFIRRRPEDIGLLPDGASQAQATTNGRPGEASTTEDGSLPEDGEPSWTTHEALRTRAFWMLAIAALLGVMGSSGLAFNMVPYFREVSGLSTALAAGVLSLSTFLSLANLGWAFLADRFTPKWCLAAAMVIAAGSVVYLTEIDSVLSAYVFGVVWGIAVGSLDVLVYMVLADYFGRVSYATIVGTFRTFEAVGLGIGHSIGPVIYDVTGSYSALIGLLLALYLLTTLLIVLCRPPAASQPRPLPL